MLNEDSAAGTPGNEDIYQNFFICLNYESRLNTVGLYIQYGIQIDSDETSHLYLSYFDARPLDPVYYSFGSRSSDVQILNAHIEPFNVIEQIKLRCQLSSTLSRATETVCDYECHSVCLGCTEPYSREACKSCAHASVYLNSTLTCVEKCPSGFMPNLNDTNKLCIGKFGLFFIILNANIDSYTLDINECSSEELNECQKNTVCINTNGSYECACRPGFSGNGMFCEGESSKERVEFIYNIS